MAKYEQKPGDIIVFKNTPKDGQELHPNAPQYTGNGLDLNGNPIRISLWLKDGAKGKFMAGSIEPPYQPQGSSRQGGGSQSGPDHQPLDPDDVPFQRDPIGAI